MVFMSGKEGRFLNRRGETADKLISESFPPVDVRGRVGLVGERQPLDKKKRGLFAFSE